MSVIYFKIPQHRHCDMMYVTSTALLRSSWRIVGSTFNQKRLHSGTSLFYAGVRSSTYIGSGVSLMKLAFQLTRGCL